MFGNIQQRFLGDTVNRLFRGRRQRGNSRRQRSASAAGCILRNRPAQMAQRGRKPKPFQHRRAKRGHDPPDLCHRRLRHAARAPQAAPQLPRERRAPSSPVAGAVIAAIAPLHRAVRGRSADVLPLATPRASAFEAEIFRFQLLPFHSVWQRLAAGFEQRQLARQPRIFHGKSELGNQPAPQRIRPIRFIAATHSGIRMKDSSWPRSK